MYIMTTVPNLPPSVVGWIYNHARKNYWRMASWYEIDDLIQDGLVCAYKCLDRYGPDLDPPHFMRLVQRTFYNHIGELLRSSRIIDDSTKIADLGRDLDESMVLDRITVPEEGDQEFYLLIKELPDTLKKVVELYMNSPEKLLRLRSKLNGANETLKERLYKLTGFDQNKDFETELRDYLWEREVGLI